MKRLLSIFISALLVFSVMPMIMVSAADPVVEIIQDFEADSSGVSATNSTVRYVVNFDVIDAEGNTTWKNLTTYGYGTVSGTAEQTGAVGTQSGTPGILHQKKGSLTKQIYNGKIA